jgi:hypothetical protein
MRPAPCQRVAASCPASNSLRRKATPRARLSRNIHDEQRVSSQPLPAPWGRRRWRCRRPQLAARRVWSKDSRHKVDRTYAQSARSDSATNTGRFVVAKGAVTHDARRGDSVVGVCLLLYTHALPYPSKRRRLVLSNGPGTEGGITSLRPVRSGACCVSRRPIPV